jgi:tetratricopeptide (TPR) repeat protein
MSQLLEILGRAITVDTAELLWHWLDTVQTHTPAQENSHKLYEIIDQARDNPAKIDKAAEQLRLYLFDNPSCVYGRMAAAAIHIHENRIEQAVTELNSVYMRQPSNTMALYALGHCYERLGNEAQAVEFYQDCLKFKKYLQLPRQRLAAIYLKNGQLEKTINEYELLKREYPDDIATLTTLGQLYIAVAKYEQAVEIFNTAILIHPDNFNDENDEVQQLMQAGNLDEALDKLDEQLESEPERVDLHAKKADCFAMLGSTSQAIAHYQQALRMRPDLLEANIKLGTQYILAGNNCAAAKQFNIAMEINDRIVDAYMGLVLAYKLLNNTADAMLILSLAASIQANTPLLFAEVATLQFKAAACHNSLIDDADSPASLFDAVIEAHRRQIAQRPENPDIYYRLGILVMNTGGYLQAAEVFEKALAINPMYSRARTKLILCLHEAGQKGKALDKVTPPDCLNKGTLELHYKTALLFSHKIKFASSLLNLHRMTETNLTSSDPTINISIVLQNLGLLDRAEELWDNLADTTTQAINM